jgi:hypothetical protein
MNGFGKIHRAFFDSSVNDTDPMTRLVFIGMIVLSDRKGRIDITVESLARRLNLGVDALNAALMVLGAPDESSRTPEHGGRRVIPIDDSRSWGWIVVNKEQYRAGDVDDDAVRADARERKRRQRERDNPNSSFTEDSSNTKNKDTPSVTVTRRHATVTPRHKVSREKCDAIFSRCWAMVPRKEGRKEARKHFDGEIARLAASAPAAEIDTILDRLESDLVSAITSYANSVTGIEPRYVKQGSTLFFNFRDYIGEWQAKSRSASAPRPEGLQGVAL